MIPCVSNVKINWLKKKGLNTVLSAVFEYKHISLHVETRSIPFLNSFGCSIAATRLCYRPTPYTTQPQMQLGVP